jgi:hypothetical protein
MYQRKLLVCLLLLCAILAQISIAYPHSRSRGSQIFTQNIGQVTDQYFMPRTDIDFKLSTANGLSVFIGGGKMHYQWMANMKNGMEADNPSSLLEMYRMDVTLIGANPNAKVITEGKSTQYERYYTNGLEGALAHGYNRITYQNIYPNIDQVFYFTHDGLLEYDFVVRQGGKVSDIRLKYSGAEELRLNSNGSLTATTPMGIVTENAPITYQQKDKKSVRSVYQLDGDILSFITADYNGTLVIDPVIEWGTYFGDTENDMINAITTGKFHEVYACGITNSLVNIATIGSHQQTFGGGTFAAGADVFVAKFDKDGNLQWSTFYGGTGNDWAGAVDCDLSGNVYIAGYSNSSNNISTTGSYQHVKAGTNANHNDAFLVKFDSLGARIWGTYYGGERQEGNSFIGLHIDKFNNIFIGGNTASDTGIATTGTYQPLRNSTSTGNDGFIGRFDTSGSLLWGTYVGGTGADYICALKSDQYGNIYVSGYTNSNNHIATSAAHQPVLGGGFDAFLMKLDTFGNRSWGSYLGGLGLDRGYSLECDDSANVYMSGTTASTTGIATLNGLVTNYVGGSSDGFLTRFDSSGNISWSTYYGGSQADNFISNGMSINKGKLYVLGSTISPSGIATPDGLFPNSGGDYDAFIVKFDLQGQREWSTYYGGAASDIGLGLATDDIGNVYIGGHTTSALGIATTGAHQISLGGNTDAFLIRLNDCEAPGVPTTILGSLTLCSNDTALYSINPVTGADAYLWILPTSWNGESDSTSITVTPNGGISGDIRVAAVNYCTNSDTISMTITISPAPEPLISRNANILSVTQVFAAYQWYKDGLAISGATNAFYAITENGSYTVTVTGSNGCFGSSKAEQFTNLSISDLDPSIFTLHPNPAIDKLYISAKAGGKMEVMDISGRNIGGMLLNEGENMMDIAHLANGVYIIHITSIDGSYMVSARWVKATL